MPGWAAALAESVEAEALRVLREENLLRVLSSLAAFCVCAATIERTPLRPSCSVGESHGRRGETLSLARRS